MADATQLNRQGNDVGTQYRSGVYCTSAEQRHVALKSKEAHGNAIGASIATEIKDLDVFYRAEDYHQHYLEKGGQCSLKGDATPIRCYG